jgi:uncharacterized protein YndB with AHSA1/START domain
MTGTQAASRAVAVERELPHPPEKVWRALTEPALIADWLMPAEFRPVVGHRFAFAADWGRVACTVLEAEPPRRLAYSWAAEALDTVVTWTLEPTATGTRLRMEQAGFRAEHPRYFQGARAGWPRFLDRLAEVLARTA